MKRKTVSCVGHIGTEADFTVQSERRGLLDKGDLRAWITILSASFSRVGAMCTSSGACGSLTLGIGSPARHHQALCRLYMYMSLQGSPGCPSLLLLRLVCRSVFEGMGFCGQPRTLKQFQLC